MAPTRRNGVQRYEAILDAALERFVADGILATRIEDVRRAAGASPSSLYHHFDGLTDIVLTLLERTFARLFALMTGRVTACGDARSSVETLVATHLDWVFAHRDEARFMYQATSLDLGPEASARVMRHKVAHLGDLVAHLDAFVARGDLPGWAHDQFDVVVLGPSHEACRRWLLGAPIDFVWMRETFPEAAWAAVSRSTRPQRRLGAAR